MKHFTPTPHNITEPIIVKEELSYPNASYTMRVWSSCLEFGEEQAFYNGYTPDQLLTYIAEQFGEDFDAGFWWSLKTEFYKAQINGENKNNPDWIM